MPMVIAHSGKVGQWSKQNAINEHRRGLLILMTTGFFTVAALGFAAGLSFNGGVLALVGLALGILFVLMGWRLVKWMDRALEQGAKRRLQYLRGGQAEAWVSMILRDQLGDRWHLFDNLMLDQSSDIDHVLIGPGGFFVISTKSTRGRFHASGQAVTMNGQPTDWHRDAVNQTFRLKEQLNAVAPAGSKNPWVQPVLALPFAHIDAPKAFCPSGEPLAGPGMIPGVAVGKACCWVLHEDNLTDALEPDPIPKHRKLGKAEVERWVAALKKLQGTRVDAP